MAAKVGKLGRRDVDSVDPRWNFVRIRKFGGAGEGENSGLMPSSRG